MISIFQQYLKYPLGQNADIFFSIESIRCYDDNDGHAVFEVPITYQWRYQPFVFEEYCGISLDIFCEIRNNKLI